MRSLLENRNKIKREKRSLLDTHPLKRYPPCLQKLLAACCQRSGAAAHVLVRCTASTRRRSAHPLQTKESPKPCIIHSVYVPVFQTLDKSMRSAHPHQTKESPKPCIIHSVYVPVFQTLDISMRSADALQTKQFATLCETYVILPKLPSAYFAAHSDIM